MKIEKARHWLCYTCRECGYESYAIPDATVSKSIYEESNKYDYYYAGKPPFMWYHRIGLAHILHLEKSESFRVLDFGCFDGFFVKRLVDEGVNAFGVDWNRVAIGKGIEKFGMRDRLFTELPEAKFNVITAFEVVEHLESPKEFFRLLANSLSEGGICVISCPSSSSLYRPKTDFPPHHLSRFTPKSLRALCALEGYDVIEHREEMSIVQLTRNWIGDLVLSRGLDVDKKTLPRSPVGDFYGFNVRSTLESVATALRFIALPVDKALHLLGYRYIGQVIVIKKQLGHP